MKAFRAVNYNLARSGSGQFSAFLGPDSPAGAGATRHSLRRFTALLVAVLVASSPVLARPSKSRARKQLEFGVEMALKGSWREAAFRFRKVVELDPDNPFALSNLGVALESTGSFDEAQEAYRKAVELAPTNDRIRENLQRLEAYLATVRNTGFVSASDPGGEGSGKTEGSDKEKGDDSES